MFNSIGLTELLLLLVVAAIFLIPFVFWIWTLVDALRHPDERYLATGQSKIVWILVIIFLGALGSLIYLFVARGKLRQLAGNPTPLALP